MNDSVGELIHKPGSSSLETVSKPTKVRHNHLSQEVGTRRTSVDPLCIMPHTERINI
jgi:hypothetical protein